MHKCHRDLVRGIKVMAPGSQVNVLSERKHMLLEVLYEGRRAVVSCAQTPRVAGNMVRAALSDVRRALNLPKTNQSKEPNDRSQNH